MSNEVVVLVSDNNYLQYTYSLIGNLKNIGKWAGDFLVILTEQPPLSEIDKLQSRNIHIQNVCNNSVKTFFGKFYVFSPYIKHWKTACYFDADFIIHDDINPLFKQVKKNKMLVDYEEFEIWRYLSDKDLLSLKELNTWFDVGRFGFNSSCMLFDTDIVSETTLIELFELKEKYKGINQHTGLADGTDQPILNFKFYDISEQIQNVNYVGRPNDRGKSIASHTCRWSAPWVHHPQYYNYGLDRFEKWE